ncbi:MAG TPA: cysteine hydrolase [Stellaceae bacterium]|nr:cysteine hydrolase [Stellaceae bacterium]
MGNPAPLPFGPLGAGTLHLCVDMQNLFARKTPWHTPWMNRVLPVVARIAAHRPERTVFTRFIPPRRPEDLPGSWCRFYRRWEELTLDRIDPEWLDLVPELASFAPPATVIDKRFYSPFSEPALPEQLRRRAVDALIITGAETDMCVLATVLDAIDRGYRVVLASDALCSSSDQTHDALITLYRTRFGEQIETAGTDAVLAAWQA